MDRSPIIEGLRFGTTSDGKGVILKDQLGLTKNYYLIEIVHTHPDHSARRFSGGEGGDVWFAERFNVSVSLSYDNKRFLYKPRGDVNLSNPRYIPERGGIKLN